MDSAHQPADEKRPPPSRTETHLPSKKQKMVMGRQQRGAPNDRAGDGGKGQGLDGPHYRVTDQDWKMSDFPDPLLSRPDHSTRLPPGMDSETDRGFWAYLQNCKDRAREADEKKATKD